MFKLSEWEYDLNMHRHFYLNYNLQRRKSILSHKEEQNAKEKQTKKQKLKTVLSF